MIIIIKTLKETVYNLLTKDLGYHVIDNPYQTGNTIFPCVVLSLQDNRRDFYNNSYLFTTLFKIDIFSNYDGEKEIFEMEEAISNKLMELYKNELITYVRESGFRILDDKSTALVRKHGIITLTIYSAGGIQDDNEANS